MNRAASSIAGLWNHITHPPGLLFPERRQSRRYLTLKNAAIAALSLFVICAFLYTWPALRPHFRGSSADLQPRISASDVAPVVRQPYPVVREGAMPDRPKRDWVLVEADAKPASPPPPPPVPAPVQPR
jgi:hypothetical protein